MYGEPEDKINECNAHLYIADNAGDNHATMRCQLEPEHEEPHKEVYKVRDKPVTVTWYGCCREEDRKWKAEFEVENGPYCESCYVNHHGKCIKV